MLKFQTNKEEESTFNNIIKVGVMLPLSGEHSEIGNLILNAIEMAVFQTEENKLELHIKDTEAKSDKAKKVLSELIDEGVKVVIGPLFSKSLAAIQSEGASKNINIFALTNNINFCTTFPKCRRTITLVNQSDSSSAFWEPT